MKIGVIVESFREPLYTAFDLLLLSYVILILISLHTQLITLFGCGDFRCS